MRKLGCLVMCGVLTAGLLTGCGNSSDASSSKSISVVSREEGSGTRDAFVGLMGIEEDDVDNTTEEANIVNSTEVVLTTVAGNEAAIGYVSLGSLNDTVKAIKVDGVEATAENIVNGSYTVSRPFNIVTSDNVSEVAQDFIDFIMSDEGQAVIEDNGYIAVEEGESYTASGLSGKIVVAGSSSVTPVMEKLQEAYEALNSGVEIEIQESDSSTGVNAAADGTCDIGMASRDLKDSETGKGLTATSIAMDGIAVVVSKDNSVEDLTTEQIKNIFTGSTTSWSDVQ